MSELQQQLGKFEAIYARELTHELAHDYVASLVTALGGADQSLAQLVAKGNTLHKDVGERIYGPLIVGYVKWVEQMCGDINHTGPVFFALRDAAPLKVTAQVLWQDKDLYPVDVYANRPLLNIEDEIDPQWAHANGNVVQYLGMLGLGKMDKIVWSDTGAWGTVVKALKVGILNNSDFHPLFWYSHNPNIPGYLNGLLGECGMEDKFGELVNDSVECLFPQPHVRPLEVVKVDETWQVPLQISCYLAQEWGNAALSGVYQAAAIAMDGQTLTDPKIALIHLQSLSAQAKNTGKWTGVLSSNTPTWSKGEEFLANWPKNLLP